MYDQLFTFCGLVSWVLPCTAASFHRTLDTWIQNYNSYIGGYLLLVLLVPTGVYFAFRLKFLHVMKLPHALKAITGKYDRAEDEGDINHFRALATALSATIGTGNMVGVSLAIYYGGPGAIFWMWVTGFFGMIIKFVECTLSFKFRKINQDGSISGGPMYYMEAGLKNRLGSFAKVLAVIFASATMLSSLGQGNMAQSNSIADALNTNCGLPPWISGLAVALLVMLVIIGGIKRIAQVTSRLVPFMGLLYLAAALLVIVSFYESLPSAFWLIVKNAFTGTAATGGFIGAGFLVILRYGVARGIFSNEAGQGSAAIAHAAAKTKYPVREGLVASVGPFLDTLVVCSLTALVIILTGTWKSGIKGVDMTIKGFEAGLGSVGIGGLADHIVTSVLVLFAFSTTISWSYYGSRAAQYLLGSKAIMPYRFLYVAFVFLGSVFGINLVWHFVDMAVTFMTIPNLIAILLLVPVVHKETKRHFGAFSKP